MGKYINKTSTGVDLGASAQSKLLGLLADGAQQIFSEPTSWTEGIVCIVDNGPFGAAGYAYDQRELDEFKAPDKRKKFWLLFPKAKDLAE